MKLYINYRSNYGLETVDEYSQSDFPSLREFIRYAKAMLSEYLMVSSGHYISRRCCSNWK